jgi:DNA-binding MarR family transcriptional regulator
MISLIASTLRRVPRDISLAALSTLSTLDRIGPQRITDLARLEGVAQPSMTVLAGALERDGFAVRRRDPSDGRVVLIGVTAAGTDLIRRRRRAGAQAFAQLIEKLPPGETAVLLTALPALRHLRELEEAQRASTLHDPSGGR